MHAGSPVTSAGSSSSVATIRSRPRRRAPSSCAPRTPGPPRGWILATLAARGVRSLLLEGGPHLNAAFLAAGLIDELYWTVGAHLLGTDALPMFAPISGGSPYATDPFRGRLVSVLRHDDELFLRYRFGSEPAGSIGP